MITVPENQLDWRFLRGSVTNSSVMSSDSRIYLFAPARRCFTDGYDSFCNLPGQAHVCPIVKM